MASIRDVVLVREEQKRGLEPVRNFVPAIIISINGSIRGPEPETVWVQEYAQPQSVYWVLNISNVRAEEGVMVTVGWPEKPPFRRQIVGLWGDIIGYDDYNEGDFLTVGLHARSHQYPNEVNPGLDKVLIFQPAIQILKTMPIGDMDVEVTPAGYWFNTIFTQFGGETLNLTSYIPSTTNYIRWILIYLHMPTGTIAIEVGDEVVSIPEKPNVPENSLPSAYVYLEEGMTEITVWEDCRQFLEATYNQYQIPIPTEKGQILISTDGFVFTAEHPMIDDDGFIMIDEDGHIMTVG